jgi:NTP pyrophosphatase (non-canonical NTP hydrolase)
MKDAQRRVNEFVTQYQLHTDVASRVLDLVSEVGEVAKEVLKGSEYGNIAFSPDRDKWTEEVGDVLFSLICLANATDLDLQSSLEGVLGKYRKRLDMKGDAGS